MCVLKTLLAPLMAPMVMIAAFAASVIDAHAQANAITLASTTSTANSGLFDFILPRFSAASGIKVRVVAVGTGQAIKLAANGDADVLFVHHRASEEKFVEAGLGVRRYDVMYNDFVLLGPKSDPAAIDGSTNAVAALKTIIAKKAPFVSRGDDSGTHKAERTLWRLAGVDVDAHSGTWYRETGSGMGATLNVAVAMSAYTLSDRATWLSFKNRSDFHIAVEGDARMFNPYGVILVNPEKFPHVHAKEGQIFIDWLVSDEGQSAIASFKIEGAQLFFPGAQK